MNEMKEENVKRVRWRRERERERNEGVGDEEDDVFFFFKQKTAYEIGTGDWSSDVCSSDLPIFCGLSQTTKYWLNLRQFAPQWRLPRRLPTAP